MRIGLLEWLLNAVGLSSVTKKILVDDCLYIFIKGISFTSCLVPELGKMDFIDKP